MEQTPSKWTRWIAVALCALALSAARQGDDSFWPRQSPRSSDASPQPAAQGTKVAASRPLDWR